VRCQSWRRSPIAGVALVIALCCGLTANASGGDQVDAISAALRARDYERAVELTREALKASPNDAQLWTLQGIALARKGDNVGALAAYRHALRISPDYIPALEGAAQLEYQAGSRDAVPLLTHLLELRPDPTSRAMLAVLYYRDGNCNAAVEHFAGGGALYAASRTWGAFAQATWTAPGAT
jgi:cytochrome c-type biogenesis protein CcmH/NrfG